MPTPDSEVRKALIEAYDESLKKEINQQVVYANDSRRQAQELRASVKASSAPDARIWQTLNHLGGKTQGNLENYAIRKNENMKESMAEDAEENEKIKKKEITRNYLLMDAPPSQKLK